jgi:hypothetical protein
MELESISNISSAEEIALLKKRKEQNQKLLESFKFVWWGWVLASLFGSFILYTSIVATTDNNLDFSVKLALAVILGTCSGVFTYAYIIISIRFIISSRIRRLEVQLIKAGSIELQEHIDENFFTKLVQINFKYLDQYYLQTQEQADKSFRLSAFAAISGLFITVAGIVMMYFGKTEPAYVTTAAGVLSEFIAAVFFYLYNKTILKMSQYHQKLVLTQNISLALKITDEMETEQKNKALEILIDRLTTDVNKHLTESK